MASKRKYPRTPTARQSFLLHHIGKGTCGVRHCGEHYSRWNIAMRADYSATSTRQPSLTEGQRLIELGWVSLETDFQNWTENTLTKGRIYHHRARLTDTGAAVLKEHPYATE